VQNEKPNAAQNGLSTKLQISQAFDSGNIEVVSADDPMDIQLNIRKDNNSDFYQWFYFRVSSVADQQLKIRILNAAGAAYPEGWNNYQVCYSYDRQRWYRLGTTYEDGELSFGLTLQHGLIYFSYFAPYSMEQHHNLITFAQHAKRCSHSVLGQTLDGQDIDLLTFSRNDGKERLKCWIMARQHPGETMGEWWMEGFIDALMGGSKEIAKAVLNVADVYIIPNMNPDGSRRGHLRTNAAGRNLNREWAEPSMEASPEVFIVKQAMLETGVDFFLDVHGDESLPYCFIAGTEGLANWSEKQQAQLDYFKDRLLQLNPDFQVNEGYPPKQPGQANMTMSTAQTAHLHDCLAMTLEMPFKDTIDTPDARYGFSIGRSERLGRACLEAMLDYLDSGLIDKKIGSIQIS